jgi:hypothetical protein
VEVALTDPLALEQIVARQGEGTQGVSALLINAVPFTVRRIEESLSIQRLKNDFLWVLAVLLPSQRSKRR